MSSYKATLFKRVLSLLERSLHRHIAVSIELQAGSMEQQINPGKPIKGSSIEPKRGGPRTDRCIAASKVGQQEVRTHEDECIIFGFDILLFMSVRIVKLT